jgi:predicted enzyme related to lactoylglutathione lyase
MVDNVSETIDKLKAAGCKITKQAEIGPGQFIAWFSDPAGNILGIYQHSGGGHGKICYLEIPANDINKSVGFYKTVFPWKIRSDNHGNAAFDDGVDVVSGMWEQGLKPLSEPGLMIYVMMDSVEETVGKVIAAGGKIVQPIGGDAPEITARFSDPFGNVLGLYQEPNQA